MGSVCRCRRASEGAVAARERHRPQIFATQKNGLPPGRAKITLGPRRLRPDRSEHRRPVSGELRISADGRAGLAIGAFDPQETLKKDVSGGALNRERYCSSKPDGRNYLASHSCDFVRASSGSSSPIGQHPPPRRKMGAVTSFPARLRA
jgi:hypothetical protein